MDSSKNDLRGIAKPASPGPRPLDAGTEPESPCVLHLAGRFFTTVLPEATVCAPRFGKVHLSIRGWHYVFLCLAPSRVLKLALNISSS